MHTSYQQYRITNIQINECGRQEMIVAFLDFQKIENGQKNEEGVNFNLTYFFIMIMFCK